MPVPACRWVWPTVWVCSGLQGFLGWGSFSAKTRKGQGNLGPVDHMTWDIERLSDFLVTSLGDRVLSGFLPRHLMYTHLSKSWHCEVQWAHLQKSFWSQRPPKDVRHSFTCEWLQKAWHMFPESPGSIGDRCCSERAMNHLSHIPGHGHHCPRLESVLFSVISKNTKEKWSWITFSF